MKETPEYQKFVDNVCEKDTVYTFQDYQTDNSKQACFCEDYLKKHSLYSVWRSTKIEDVKNQDRIEAELCISFKVIQWKQLLLVFGVSLTTIIINEGAVWIFEKVVGFEKNHSKNEETQGLFRKIIILQFIDTAVINLLVNVKIAGNFKSSLWLIGMII